MKTWKPHPRNNAIMTSEAILKLNDIHTYYGNIHALKGVSCSIFEGEIVCLIGANGAGKSTTLMTIFGVQRASEGQILFKGKPIQDLRPEKVAALGISQTPEGRQIFPRMSTFENLEMGAFLRKDKAKIQKDMEWVFSLFPVLKDRMRQLGGTLSGGEQQMLAIGRALMSRPELLLLDEPSLGLAPKMVEKIFETIIEINKSGVTIFLVEQNAHMALTISDSGYVMETGRIVLKDKASALLENEQVQKAYLGE
jgi:branched-chain amino acid transport system ATP-binding protein